MPKLLLNLRYVPDDEAEDVRALLEERQIPFYETQPSPWGVSAGAIWIKHAEDVDKARQLLAEYQLKRQTSARADYTAAKREGRADTLWATLREDPVRVVGVLLGIVFLVGVMALPFLLLGN